MPHACLTYFRDTLKPSLGILELDGSDELQREREKPGPPKGPKSAAGHIDSATQRIRPWTSEREESRDPPRPRQPEPRGSLSKPGREMPAEMRQHPETSKRMHGWVGSFIH